MASRTPEMEYKMGKYIPIALNGWPPGYTEFI
jgi:hypothetical protein